MKLKELESILYSSHGRIQTAILYDVEFGLDLDVGNPVDSVVKRYGELIVNRIEAFDDNLVIGVTRPKGGLK